MYVTQEMDEVLRADRVGGAAGGPGGLRRPARASSSPTVPACALSLGLPPAAEVGLALLARGALPRLPFTLDELVAALQARAP